MSTGGRAADQTAPGTPGTAPGAPGPARGPRGALPSAPKIARRLVTAPASWTLLFLIAVAIGFTIAAPGRFLTGTNMSFLAVNAATLLIMAVGQTFVIITAGIDLSVGSVLVLAGVLADEYYLHNGGTNAGWGVIVAGALIGLAVGAGFGTVQGFVVAKGKVPPLIVTLAGFGVALGASYLISGGVDLRTVPNRLVDTIGFGGLGGLRWMIIIAFLIAIVCGLILAYTRFGRYTYAIGSNPEAARRAGINVDRHLIKVYGLQGLLSGAAGIVALAFFETTGISQHLADNLTVITAVVLGGASLFGGRGLMLGTVIGLFIPAMVQNGLIIKNVNPYWQYVVNGVILVAAVYLDQFRLRLRDRA